MKNPTMNANEAIMRAMVQGIITITLSVRWLEKNLELTN